MPYKIKETIYQNGESKYEAYEYLTDPNLVDTITNRPVDTLEEAQAVIDRHWGSQKVTDITHTYDPTTKKVSNFSVRHKDGYYELYRLELLSRTYSLRATTTDRDEALKFLKKYPNKSKVKFVLELKLDQS